MEHLINFFSSKNFMPHGHCYLWRPDILWLNVGSDALIAISYFSIPASLIYLVRRRKDLAFNWVFVMFALFIVACGATHLFDIWTVWTPNYAVEGLMKLATGLVSAVTAVALWFLMPKAISIPSTADLELLNNNLQNEIKDREKVQLELKEFNEELERRVQDRTQAITELNRQLESKIEIQQRSEEEIQRLNRDLRNRIDEMQKIFDLAPVGIAVASDPTCQVITTNPFCAKLLGIASYENASLSGNAKNLPFYVTTPDGKKLIDSELPMQKAAATGQEIHALEVDVIRDDGTTISLYEYAVPLFDDSKKIRGCLGIFVDITERKSFEREIRKAKDIAEAANKAKSEFLANMSHEIRTPLNSILGFSQLLCEAMLSEGEKVSFIETIDRNGRALTQLIDDILDLSKVEAGHVSLDIVNFSLNNLIKDLMLTLKNAASIKGLVLELQQTDSIPTGIKSDPVRLKQILLNVIGNAIKFTHSGTVTISIDTFQLTEGDEHFLRFRITDTGIGISDAAKKRIFQPFAQADSSTTRRFGGTGLGLALSRKLAIALGGNIELSASKLNEGSTFSVWISLVGHHSESSKHTLVSEDIDLDLEKNNPSLPLSGYRILVAEDSSDNRTLIHQLLTRSGAKVELVENGQEAVDQVKSTNFDLVIMDLQMPIVDGYKATKELRRQGFKQPIIALTAHAMAGEKENAKAVGFDDYVTKPINAKALIQSLVELLKSTGRHPTG